MPRTIDSQLRVEEQCCGNCLFWGQTRASIGECQRHPPVPKRGKFRRPLMRFEQWCGEWGHPGVEQAGLATPVPETGGSP